jgi:hypothetical protein
MRKSESWFNPQATKIVDAFDCGREIVLEQVNLALLTTSFTKRNGDFCARLVACGYSQVPGVDFTESFAPVLNDVSFRLMLISKLVWDMKSTVVDIETAFLHGHLDKEIYMDVPMGLSIGPTRNCFYDKQSTV